MNTFTKKSLSVVLASTLLLSPMKPTHADTPAAVVIGAVVGVVGAMAAVVGAGAAVVGAVAAVVGVAGGGDDSGGTTTTTTTTTTTDTSGETTTTTTTTTTSNMTAGGSAPGQWFGFTELQKNPIAGVAGMSYDKIDNHADVKRTAGNTQRVTYDIVRKTLIDVTRTETTGKELSVPFVFSAKKIMLTTKDIPGTNGQSAMDVQVKAEGRELYHFTASVSQGKKPMFSKDVAYSKLKEDKDILEIDNLKKDLQVRLPAGKSKLRLEVIVTTHGIGQRL